jgi:hypothetical protein
MEKQCNLLEKRFMTSFVHGMFQSLQAGQYIYRGDIEMALRLCKDTKVSIDTTEFNQVAIPNF